MRRLNVVCITLAAVWAAGCHARGTRDAGAGGQGASTATGGNAGHGGPSLLYDRGPYGQSPTPRALYVDGNDLIWAESANEGVNVVRAPKDGSGTIVQLGTWQDGDRSLRLFASDADTIYWLSGWQIKRVKKSGAPLPDLDINPHVSYGGLLSDGDVLYVADLNCATIGSVPKSGAAATFVTNPMSVPGGGVTDIAFDDKNVYCASGASVFAWPKGSPTTAAWVTDQEAAGTLALSDTTVFWINNRHALGTHAENLASTSKAAPHTTSVLATVGGQSFFLYDTERRSLFGIMSGGEKSMVFSYAVDTNTVAPLFSNTRIDGGFAQDSTFVYWVSDTKIWRLPKDPPPAL